MQCGRDRGRGRWRAGKRQGARKCERVVSATRHAGGRGTQRCKAGACTQEEDEAPGPVVAAECVGGQLPHCSDGQIGPLVAPPLHML